MNITSGRIHTAQKVVIYGVEGIGKTTFAAAFPDPIFIDTEGGTRFFDVKRFDAPSSWTMLLSQIDYIIQNKPCQTLVLDTADWSEKLCYDSVCATNNWKSIESPGYGAGYRYAYEEMGKLLNKLSEVIDAGINVVIVAHAALRKFEQPDEMGAYDRYEMKLQNSQKCNTAAMMKEWADCVLFANYQTFVVKDGEGKHAKNKAQGSRRVMYANRHACWDAKNRYGLPDELPFDYEEIRPYIEGGTCKNDLQVQNTNLPEKPDISVVVKNTTTTSAPKQPEQPAQSENRPINIPDGIPKALADLMRENEVDEEEIRLAVSQKGYFPYDTPITNYDPDFIDGCLIAAWGQVFQMIKDSRDLPF